MFHVISAGLRRLGRRIESRLAIPGEFAAWHGWETRRIRRGTTEYRDPRFGQPATGKTTRLVNLVEALLSEGFDVTATDGTGDVRTWTHAALGERISRVQVINTAANGGS